MIKFLLYIFESGLCLSLFYLVYALFFRKETYFVFNRIYLIWVLLFSLIIPLVHVTFIVARADKLDDTFSEISKIRNYYSDFLFNSELENQGLNYASYEPAIFENDGSFAGSKSRISEPASSGQNKALADTNVTLNFTKLIKVVICIYITGVLIFTIRLLFLIFGVIHIIRQNPRLKHSDYQLVQVKKDMPPFSFFRYIFVTKDALKLNEFKQILEHEKVHVRQKHSLDLVLAHLISVFQWFNPLAWCLQKAIKTTHEYIADSKVLKQGFELFDYQSLLLRQLISIRSVALVNNFNLLSIKKRLAMMNKNRSRFSAKMKALLAIPAAAIIFLLFAQLTVKSPVLSFTNFNSAKSSNLDGLWINHNDNTFGKLLHFQGAKLEVLESIDEVKVIDLNIKIKDEKLVLTGFGPNEAVLKYQFNENTLNIWWKNNEYSTYERTSAKNSYSALLPEKHQNIELPIMSEAKILERQDLVCKIYVYPDRYYVEEVMCTLSDLKKTLQNSMGAFNVLDRPMVMMHLFVDNNTEMKAMYDLYQVLRELRYYKIAYGVLPDNKHSVLQYHAAGITQMLPPTKKDGIETFDYEEIGDDLIILTPDENYEKQAARFKQFLRDHPKYIASYEWNNNTKYGAYVAVMNMAHKVIYELRDEVAQKQYKMKYTDLPDDLSRSLRKANYPMRISQNNTDEDPR